MTHWFHLECAAYKRPEPFLAAIDELAVRGQPLEDAERFRGEAKRGLEHPRLPRIDGAERDPSGRAQCRACHTPISKGAWRIRLVFYEEGRFSAAGAIHLPCVAAYIGTNDIQSRVQRFAPALTAAELEEISLAVRGPQP
jgi:hypothetical protein